MRKCCFLRSLFLSIAIDFLQGKAVSLLFYFNMNVYIQEITCCGTLGVGGSEGGCPSQVAFLLLLWDNVITCSLFFLFSCDSATQSSLECGIHLPHCYYQNLLKGDFVLKT